MTEQEWLTGADVGEMVRYLEEEHRAHRFKKGQRQFRLFTSACCRLTWDLMTDERARQAVLLAERYADGLVSKDEMKAAHKAQSQAFIHVLNISHQYSPAFCAADCAHAATISLLYPNGSGGALFSTRYARFAMEFTNRATGFSFPSDGPKSASAQRQAAILRDVFGNPFRPVTFAPAWQRWNGGAVVGLARTIYEERAFDQLPVLADALEEAGCTETTILDHCRSIPAEQHVRGCWVVDGLKDGVRKNRTR